jgi:hypothetical protein
LSAGRFDLGVAVKRAIPKGLETNCNRFGQWSQDERHNRSSWGDYHLRNARGEPLSVEEERLYQIEMARQDQAATPLNLGWDELRRLREEIKELERTDGELRSRLLEITNEIRLVEKSLNPASRAALGVTE